MFSYNYIVPTGPSGYNNYSNQQPSNSTSTPQQTVGAAQSYYGTPQPQYTQIVPGTATLALSQLVPAQTVVHLARENIRLSQFYIDVEQWVTPPLPNHETRYISSVSDFEKWMNEVYHPKMRTLESMRAGVEAFQQRLEAFAEESCRLGTAAHTFLTEHLEIGDVFDLLVLIERRLEEIYQELLTMDELKIEIESNTNASDCYSNSKTKYAQQWEAYKDTTKKTARRNFHQARSLRKRAHADKLTHYVTTADKIDTPPYEAIMNAIAAIPAINSQQDVDVLSRTQTVLVCARDQGTYIDGIRFAAYSDMMVQEEVHAPMVDAEYSQQSALLQRQQQIITDMPQQAATQRKAVEDHYIEWGAKPILKLLDAYHGTNQLQTAMTTYNPAPYNAVQPNDPAAPGNVTQVAPAPKFQMPYSWYSNMMTQQHVTNMQVMNNIAGGSTNFHLANSSGYKIW
ncbi:hypothetical protein IQ07DRAFT_637026 [Pyrenochaeta sp. DS3sAY3a]|nr:hypothetical protein IQ07DRAFT_637026 [Pyrenochaeta sp. DS3sAY3a]